MCVSKLTKQLMLMMLAGVGCEGDFNKTRRVVHAAADAHDAGLGLALEVPKKRHG